MGQVQVVTSEQSGNSKTEEPAWTNLDTVHSIDEVVVCERRVQSSSLVPIVTNDDDES